MVSALSSAVLVDECGLLLLFDVKLDLLKCTVSRIRLTTENR